MAPVSGKVELSSVLPYVGFSRVMLLLLLFVTVLDLLLVFHYCGCKYMLSVYVIKCACEIVPVSLRPFLVLTLHPTSRKRFVAGF